MNEETQNLDLMEREVRVKELELEHKISQAQKSTWRSPLVVAILAAAVAAIGNAGVTYYSDRLSREASALTAENERILEAIKLGYPDNKCTELQFLIDANLIQTEVTVRSISAHCFPQGDPGSQVAGSVSIPLEISRNYSLWYSSGPKLYELNAEEGGTVRRSDSEACSTLGWVIETPSGVNLVRNAVSELSYRYFRSGSYYVHLRCFDEDAGAYRAVSDSVRIQIP